MQENNLNKSNFCKVKRRKRNKLGVDVVSSTEIEVVSTGERFPKCIWFRFFHIVQGEDASMMLLCKITRAVFYSIKIINSPTESVPNTCTQDTSLS